MIRFRMSSTQLDDRGVLVTCPKCGQRNRLKYDKLGGSGRCGKCGTELSAPGEPIDVASDLAFDALTTRSALPVFGGFLGALVRSVQDGRAGTQQGRARRGREMAGRKSQYRERARLGAPFSH